MKTKMRPNISKSLLNAFNQYRKRELCGKLFEALYIEKSLQTESTDSAKLGQWFEYICTGYVQKNGNIPEPETKGKKGELTEKYLRMLENQLPVFKEIYKDFTVIEYGVTIENEWFDSDELWNLKIIVDCLCENDIIRDIKTTGLINDKWNEHGWGGDITTKESIMMQPLLYCFVYWKRYGIIPKFFFDIFDTGTASDVRIIEVVLTEYDLIDFESKLSEIVNSLKLNLLIGFEAFPCLKNCKNCPLKNNCDLVCLKPITEKVTMYKD